MDYGTWDVAVRIIGTLARGIATAILVHYMLVIAAKMVDVGREAEAVFPSERRAKTLLVALLAYAMSLCTVVGMLAAIERIWH